MTINRLSTEMKIQELNRSMIHYVGTKEIRATPMSRRDYNDLRGWTLPEDEDGDDEGYLVEYTDGGKANVEGIPRMCSKERIIPKSRMKTAFV